METPNYRYILYARKSSEEKSKQARSIDSQLEELLPFAERERLDLVETLKEARTAKEPGRPLFGQMLRMLERGEADAILCWHLNRLTRNEKDSGDLRWLLRTGVIKEIRTPSRVYRPEDSAFVTAVETAAGEQFIQDLIKGSYRGTMTKVRSGGVPYRAPAGYRNNRLTRTVEADPETFPLIRRAWERLLAGEPVPRIAEECPVPLAVSRWYTLFASRFYTGRFPYMGRLYLGTYPPMVTEEEYGWAQEILGFKSKPRPSKHRFAYAGLLTCARCGHGLCGDLKTKRRADGGTATYTYYACSLGARGRCTRQSVREDRFEAELRRLLAEARLDPEFWELASGVARRWLDADAATTVQDRQEREKRRATLAGQRQRLLHLHLEGRVDEAAFDAEDRRLEAELRALARAGADTATPADRWDTVADRLTFAARSLAAFDALDLDGKATLARRIAPRYVLSDGVLTIDAYPWLLAVRTYVQSAAYGREKFELQKIGSQSITEAEACTKIPVWRRLVEDVRTAAGPSGALGGT